MDLSFTPEDTEFQKEVRDWIATAYTPDLRAKMAMSKNGYLDKAEVSVLIKKCFAER